MPLLSETHTCLAIDSGDLVVSLVRTSPLGIRTAPGPRVASYLDSGDTERSELTHLDRTTKISLVVPGAWCASRPMPLTAQRWEKSRAEIAASIDTIFPLSPDDALLEYVQLAPSSDEPAEAQAGGILIAISRSHLAPWLERIERDLGRAPDRIVSSHAALLGVGLQRHDSATVIETDAVGAPMAHTFIHGLPVAMDDPAPSSSGDGTTRCTLPGTDAGAFPGAIPINAHDLAAGAPIAEHICPGVISPFHGRRTPPLKSMALPAAVAAAAVVIFASASLTSDARLQSGLDKLTIEQESLAPLVEQAQHHRAETERLISNTNRVRALTASEGEQMLTLLAAGHRVLPEDGYIYRARFTPTAVELRGQCNAVGDLFREIESSTLFSDAKRLSPSAPVDGGATFDIAASVSQANARSNGGAP